MPPKSELRKIVAECALFQEAISLTLPSVQSAVDTSAALRQSVLAAAFRGELVPQDPKDEPASVLLDRIRAQRAATAAAPKARKTGPTAPAKRKRA